MENELDRRSRRTEQALTVALIDLLGEKNYDAITIQDIVDRADVGRSTFYAHFQTKDDLLKKGFGKALDLLLQHCDITLSQQVIHWDVSVMFRHAQGHYEIYRTLFWGSGYQLITMDGLSLLSEKMQHLLSKQLSGWREPAIELSVLSHMLAGSLLNLLKWWLDHKMPYPPERMDEIFQQLVMPGFRGVLGKSVDLGE